MTRLPISLGDQTGPSDPPVVVATTPATNVLLDANGNLVSSISVDTTMIEPHYCRANVVFVTVMYLDGTDAFDIVIKRGTGDTDNVTYEVGLNNHFNGSEKLSEYNQQLADEAAGP